MEIKSKTADADFEIVLDRETAEKISSLLNDESLMHAGFVAHQSNNNTLMLPAELKVAA